MLTPWRLAFHVSVPVGGRLPSSGICWHLPACICVASALTVALPQGEARAAQRPWPRGDAADVFLRQASERRLTGDGRHCNGGPGVLTVAPRGATSDSCSTHDSLADVLPRQRPLASQQGWAVAHSSASSLALHVRARCGSPVAFNAAHVLLSAVSLVCTHMHAGIVSVGVVLASRSQLLS